MFIVPLAFELKTKCGCRIFFKEQHRHTHPHTFTFMPYTGNELMHRLTTDGRKYTLRVDLEGYNGEKISATYTDFWIGPESDSYRLHVSTAGLLNHLKITLK